MLQQTQVKTVIPYFTKFVKKIPNLKSLSTSNEKKVLKLWEGLGYYRRAKNLLKTAKILTKANNGKLPIKFEEIKNSLVNDEEVKISGFGNFKILNKKERPGRNPKTGEPALISARKVVTFKAGQKLRKKLATIQSE